MTITTGPNLGLAVNGSQGEPHYPQLMAQWRGLDCLVQPVVLDKDLTAPPASPTDGAAYLVPASATGAWNGKTGQITRFSSVLNDWEFYVPKKGWAVYVQDESLPYRYSGTAWAAEQSSSSAVRVLAQSGASSSVTGSTAETTLATIQIPAGAMGANGLLRVTMLFTFPSSSNTKNMKVKLGSTTVMNLSSTTTTSAKLQVEIRARNSTGAQISQASNKANFGDTSAAVTTSALDMTALQNLTITGTLANSSETLALEGYTVELLNP